jgi:hypothetical protein
MLELHFLTTLGLVLVGTSILLFLTAPLKNAFSQASVPSNFLTNNLVTQDSGIRGMVTLGPIHPVERPSVKNYRPYQANITVLNQAGETVTTFQSGTDGKFQIKLKLGIYTLRPEAGTPYPRAAEQTVIVSKGKFTEVCINYDSGIR